MPARFATCLPGSAAWSVLRIDLHRRAALEEQQRAGRQHRQIGYAVEHEIGADPFRPDLRQTHPSCDNRQFVWRDDRQLPLIANFGAARIPRLAPAGAARMAEMHIAWDAFEAELQRLTGLVSK